MQDKFFQDIVKDKQSLQDFIDKFIDKFTFDFSKVLNVAEPFNPYPVWNDEVVWGIDNKVISESNGFVYKSLVEDNIGNSLSDITKWQKESNIASVKEYFNIEIANATREAVLYIGRLLARTGNQEKLEVFMYLVAFFLTTTKKQTQFEASITAGVVASKSIGGANISYSIPLTLQNDPEMYIYRSNIYGIRYLYLKRLYQKLTPVNAYSGHSYGL